MQSKCSPIRAHNIKACEIHQPSMVDIELKTSSNCHILSFPRTSAVIEESVHIIRGGKEK